jgi:hypothetical protein
MLCGQIKIKKIHSRKLHHNFPPCHDTTYAFNSFQYFLGMPKKAIPVSRMRKRVF